MNQLAFTFANWAVVAHKDNTGFGRMAADARAVLGIGHHFVIPSERLKDHPVDGLKEMWLPKDAPEAVVRDLLARVEGIIFFERQAWHPHLLRIARELGVATVCVPMWEWFKGDAPEWQYCDLFACPSRFTEKIVRSYGWTKTTVLPWTIDLAKFSRRQVSGPARLFVHNAGLVDRDDRKGTLDTIAAFSRVRREDIRLLVRMQQPTELPRLDPRVEVQVGNLSSPGELYVRGDAFIQPSKMEGIGFMVIEPVCCGLPVITTDHAPMNEFVRQPEMRCELRWFKRRAFASQWIRHAYLRLPNVRRLGERIAWAAAHDLGEISTANGAWAASEFEPERLRRLWRESLASVRSVGRAAACGARCR